MWHGLNQQQRCTLISAFTFFQQSFMLESMMILKERGRRQRIMKNMENPHHSITIINNNTPQPDTLSAPASHQQGRQGTGAGHTTYSCQMFCCHSFQVKIFVNNNKCLLHGTKPAGVLSLLKLFLRFSCPLRSRRLIHSKCPCFTNFLASPATPCPFVGSVSCCNLRSLVRLSVRPQVRVKWKNLARSGNSTPT